MGDEQRSSNAEAASATRVHAASLGRILRWAVPSSASGGLEASSRAVVAYRLPTDGLSSSLPRTSGRRTAAGELAAGRQFAGRLRGRTEIKLQQVGG